MTDPLTALVRISTEPDESEQFKIWLECVDALTFLRDSANATDFVVYAGLDGTFIHAVMVPSEAVTPPDVDDLLSWNGNPYSSWGMSYTFSEPPTVSISGPLESIGSATLESGEQLVFGRSFSGRFGEKTYYEAAQRLVHLFDLHFLSERNAYSRLDEHGDIEDVIRILSVPSHARRWGGTVITFDRQILEEYMAVSGSVIVRMFDFTRVRHGNFGGWNRDRIEERTDEGDTFYRSTRQTNGGYLRGCQLVRPVASQSDVARKLGRRWSSDDRQYASFIAQDWKNNVVQEISCAPGCTANYFTESELPYETSPAFFRPEVLTKYKADSEKYTFRDRSISCRGAWHLKTYDINEAGQVHTYIVYLRHLPYQEQLHWKAYNEAPKGAISKRAFKTDFEGSWESEYDPLVSLKAALREATLQNVNWWTLRDEHLLDQVHYPATASADEWAEEILRLDQLLVEGFELKSLRQQAQALERTPSKDFRSLKLLEECLIGIGLLEADARKITEPFHEVHTLRSKIKGHASGKEAIVIKKSTLTKYGSYRIHFSALSAACDESFRAIAEMFRKRKAPARGG